MGMDQTVTFPTGHTPDWAAVSDLLTRCDFPVQMRMIDGQLAFPDESPPDTWQELRLGTPHGMITVRRTDDSVVLVTWGNADSGLRQDWNALTWAFAAAGSGQVITERGPQSVDDYRRSADLPPTLCPALQ
jgi:hypothetical protein